MYQNKLSVMSFVELDDIPGLQSTVQLAQRLLGRDALVQIVFRLKCLELYMFTSGVARFMRYIPSVKRYSIKPSAWPQRSQKLGTQQCTTKIVHCCTRLHDLCEIIIRAETLDSIMLYFPSHGASQLVIHTAGSDDSTATSCKLKILSAPIDYNRNVICTVGLFYSVVNCENTKEIESIVGGEIQGHGSRMLLQCLLQCIRPYVQDLDMFWDCDVCVLQYRGTKDSQTNIVLMV